MHSQQFGDSIPVFDFCSYVALFLAGTSPSYPGTPKTFTGANELVAGKVDPACRLEEPIERRSV
jgi:hypothetical protein